MVQNAWQFRKWISLGFVVLGAALSFGLKVARADETIPLSADYREVRSFIENLAKAYPERSEIFTLGISDSGEPIVGLKVGAGPVRHLVVSTHHGNEYGSTEVAKAFAKSVAENPIQGQATYIIPVLNISGYNQRNRRETAGGRTFDPNRDYPGPCGTEGPFHLKSTRALAEFIDREQIIGSATLHTFTPAVVYPWGISSHDLSTPYDDLFKMLVQAATVESKYQSGNNTELIYPADGTFEDYAFWKHGIWSILFELGYSHTPTDDAVREMQQVNVPGLRRMFAQTPTTRAERHDFTGKCDTSLKGLDRHDE